MLTCEEVLELKDSLRSNLVEYSMKAFQVIPTLKAPRILDIGCGSGVVTLELARMTDGEIIGLDIDQSVLSRLEKKIERMGLSDRVRVICRSMLDMGFPAGYFDMLWAEGTIHIIGFKKGLGTWYPFLKRGGYLVLHDEASDLQSKLRMVSEQGFQLVDLFVLPEDVWFARYFEPLEVEMNGLRRRLQGDDQASALLDDLDREMDMVKKDPANARSAFMILKKIDVI